MKRYVFIIILLLFTIQLISAGEKYYVVEQCMLREWQGIDDNDMRELMVGEAVEYLSTESGECEEYVGIRNIINTTSKKVKTENNEQGWIASAFLIQKKSMTNLSTNKKSRTIEKIISIIENIHNDTFASMSVSELESY